MKKGWKFLIIFLVIYLLICSYGWIRNIDASEEDELYEIMVELSTQD